MRSCSLRGLCLIAVVFGVACNGQTPIDLKNFPKDIIFFGDNSGADYFGEPVSLTEDKDGKASITVLQFPATTDWSAACKEAAMSVKSALDNNFDLIALRDSLRAQDNGPFWDLVRAKWGLVSGNLKPDHSNEDDVKKMFLKLFTKYQDEAVAFFPRLVSPLVETDMAPSSRLGLSQTDFDGNTNVKVSDRFKVGLTYKNLTVHFFVISEWGRLALTKPIRNCLVAAAKTMSPRPTHIVDGITLGVLFEFSIGMNSLKANATVSANMVEVSADFSLRNVKINATLFGQMTPSNYKTSITEIYDPKANAPPDKQLLNYFESVASSIKTPVFVSGHLVAVK